MIDRNKTKRAVHRQVTQRQITGEIEIIKFGKIDNTASWLAIGLVHLH